MGGTQPRQPDEVEQRGIIRQDTASHLQTLYTVGAGLGVAVAIDRLFEEYQQDYDVAGWSIPQFIAFVVTLVPFFHGAMRHMTITWGGRDDLSPFLMMFDFSALFLQTIAFFVMAEFIGNPGEFAVTLVALLAIDILWLSIRRRWEPNPPPVQMWVRINVPTVVILVGLLALWSHFPWDERLLGMLVCVVATVRTLLDYRYSQTFYFGPRTSKH